MTSRPSQCHPKLDTARYLIKCSAVNLTYQCLFQGINDLARQAGIRDFQVQFKKTTRGESVFALIVPDDEPSSLDSNGYEPDPATSCSSGGGPSSRRHMDPVE
jgi:hypothetical protein